MRRGDEASLPLRSQAKPRRPDCVRNCLTCRCTVHCSAWCVVACVACIAGVVAAGRELARHPFPVPATPPPPPCGVWPYDNPCEHCLYGVAQTLTVGPGTTCDSLARRLSVPQFELFNRNRSTSCCQQWNISLTDRIDVCRGPDREQWRRAGHPRQLPHANIIFSYIGAIGQHVQGPQNADLQLPESINVAAIGPIQDDILPGKSGNGFFRFEGEPGSNGFTGNCSVQVDPTSERRGSGGAGVARADARRVWLLSLLPAGGGLWSNQGNWEAGQLSADEWGRAAARSLGAVILRYRLDGLDINIEKPRKNFGLYVCSLIRHLKDWLDAPDLVITVTPNPGMGTYYGQVATQCGVNVSLAQYQTYSDSSQKYDPKSGGWAELASHFGWGKTTWGVGTSNGRGAQKTRPAVQKGLSVQRQIQQLHPEARGVFVWTAEYSARCRPAWCVEKLLARTMRGEAVPPPEAANCMC